nr:T9SS type A sorting domain-containing protein [uncultured Prevotella sp.]
MVKKIFTPFILTLILLMGAVTSARAEAPVELIEQELPSITITVTNNVLRVVGAEDEVLSIYNITGVKVMNVRVDSSDKHYTLSFPRGCYIVKVGKVVRKISIR